MLVISEQVLKDFVSCYVCWCIYIYIYRTDRMVCVYFRRSKIQEKLYPIFSKIVKKERETA